MQQVALGSGGHGGLAREKNGDPGSFGHQTRPFRVSAGTVLFIKGLDYAEHNEQSDGFWRSI
jgi:hypothetical protein